MDGSPLDRWQVLREFAVITTAAGLGDQWAPRELRHSFVSILSAHGVRLEDISALVGHSGTTVTESVYRHEIRPALNTGATAMNKILAKKRARTAEVPRTAAAQPVTQRHQKTSTGVAPRLAPEDPKGVPDRDPKPLLTC